MRLRWERKGREVKLAVRRSVVGFSELVLSKTHVDT